MPIEYASLVLIAVAAIAYFFNRSQMRLLTQERTRADEAFFPVPKTRRTPAGNSER